MLDLEGQFQSIRGGLNMRHQGGYLFAGASTTTDAGRRRQPGRTGGRVPTSPTLFDNDTLKTASRVAEGTTLETGFLADELGTDMLGILRDIQTYHSTARIGPADAASSTEAQKTFLTAQLSRLEQAGTAVVDKMAQTGSLAKQVESITDSHEAQKTVAG